MQFRSIWINKTAFRFNNLDLVLKSGLLPLSRKLGWLETCPTCSFISVKLILWFWFRRGPFHNFQNSTITNFEKFSNFWPKIEKMCPKRALLSGFYSVYCATRGYYGIERGQNEFRNSYWDASVRDFLLVMVYESETINMCRKDDICVNSLIEWPRLDGVKEIFSIEINDGLFQWWFWRA